MIKTQTIHQGVAVQQTLPQTLSLADHQRWFPHFHNDIYIYISYRKNYEMCIDK